MQKIRAVVIGGSNTVMHSAYVSHLPGCAKLVGFDLEIAANLAGGNTSSLTGLMQVKSTDFLRDSDYLIIEYALNDTVLYGEDRSALEAWVKAYEGIIRHALTVNPDIKILSVILYNLQGSHRTSLPPIPAGIAYLTDWYGISKVDINQEFTRRFGGAYHEALGVYDDPAHYSRPVFTRLIAEAIADGVKETERRTEARRPLPPPVDPANYQDARTIACAAWKGLPKAAFKNSVYSVEAADLSDGDVVLRVQKGRLLAALFVCVPQVSKLYVTLDGQAYECATLRPSIRDGRFKFLLATVNLEAVPAPSEGGGVYTLSIAPPATGAALVARQRGSAAHVDGPGTSFPVVKLMHTGTVSEVRVALRTPDEVSEAAR